jgi:hypothetical protein
MSVAAEFSHHAYRGVLREVPRSSQERASGSSALSVGWDRLWRWEQPPELLYQRTVPGHA